MSRTTERGLRRFVGPEIYQCNSFRVIGLDVTASARAVRRRAEEARDDERIAEACRQLGDPTRRIIDEFFWHWPGYDAHNRAVDAHPKALADPAGEVDWAGVRLRWHQAACDEDGWDYARDRILRLDEPECARRLRGSREDVALAIVTAVPLRVAARCDSRSAAELLRRAEALAETDDSQFLIYAARMAAAIGHEVRQLCWFCGQPSAPESTARVRLVRRRTMTEQMVVDELVEESRTQGKSKPMASAAAEGVGWGQRSIKFSAEVRERVMARSM
ncbi:hypothetical protein ACIHDR_04135 [Nocardia sp. NPDC052278]|uniref:hypothetical protein n=1 Tax=unclassified Nocardia TaxID=2637762 RepID=UPI0036A4F808